MKNNHASGILAQWFDDKGYGFIKPHLGGEPIFVHISDFDERLPCPQQGQRLNYITHKDNQGRLYAVIASKTARRRRQTPQQRRRAPSAKHLSIPARLALIASLFIALLVASRLQLLPINIVFYYAGISLITFMVYAIDKQAARRQGWRIKETHLHLLALLGGWPGALLSQQLLRHKSSKKSFRITLWLTVFINGALLFYLVSAPGQRLLNLI